MFVRLDSEFQFETDLAASHENAKCQNYFTESDDAMSQEWSGVCWLNPPYGSNGKPLRDWVKKAFDETRKPGCTVVMLIPARTNTNWWHRWCMNAKEIRFVDGRPKFGDAEHGLPQPLAIIVFEQTEQPLKVGSIDCC